MTNEGAHYSSSWRSTTVARMSSDFLRTALTSTQPTMSATLHCIVSCNAAASMSLRCCSAKALTSRRATRTATRRSSWQSFTASYAASSCCSIAAPRSTLSATTASLRSTAPRKNISRSRRAAARRARRRHRARYCRRPDAIDDGCDQQSRRRRSLPARLWR